MLKYLHFQLIFKLGILKYNIEFQNFWVFFSNGPHNAHFNVLMNAKF